MKKVLITGISGFVGKHLARHLLSLDQYEITGTYRSESGISELYKEEIDLIKVDLLDPEEVSKIILSLKPDQVYHLAAMASPAQSFKDPLLTMTNNITGELNIFETLRKANMKETRTFIVSTAEVYGKVESSKLPINESTELKPISPYAVSKITQDYMSLQYHLAYGLDVVRVRSFNHIGPGQGPDFAIASFAKQIAEIEKGEKEPVLKVGNLGAKRDFTDVRDIVRAYQLLMERGASGEVYNVGSGKSYSIQEMLDKLLALSKKEIKVEVDPAKLRPVDIEDVICDKTKMSSLTGWVPEVSLDRTLGDLLDYWRSVV